MTINQHGKHEPSSAGSSADWRMALPLVIAFVILATSYSMVLPLWEAPDEVGHYAYVSHLLRNHELPVMRPGETGEAHQPPLYYWLAAAIAAPAGSEATTGSMRANPRFVWAAGDGKDLNIAVHGSAETFPYRGVALAFHLARAVSVLLGACTVVMTWLLVRELATDRKVALLAVLLVALNPQFLFISGAISNDNLIITLSSVVWWLLVRRVRAPGRARPWWWIGLVLSAALLTKMSAIVLYGAAGAVLVWCAWRERSWALLIRGMAAIALPTAILTGWWFYRNWALYGDPTGWTVFEQVFSAVLREGDLHWRDMQEFATTQFRSFWGVFGWMTVPAPDWFYHVWLGLSLLGTGGLALSVVKSQHQAKRRASVQGLWLLSGAVVLQEAFLLSAITRFDGSWYQGRYLFPVITPLMALMALGLDSLLPRRLRAWFMAPLVAGLLGLALYALLAVIRPAYAVVPLPKSALWFGAQRTQLAVGESAELRGHKLEAVDQELLVTLYWRAVGPLPMDYSAFVHLIDAQDQMVTQEDHAPGEEQGYPPTAWWPGDIVADEHRLPLPDTLLPGVYRVRVGLYDWQTNQPLSILKDGVLLGTHIILEDSWTLSVP